MAKGKKGKKPVKTKKIIEKKIEKKEDEFKVSKEEQKQNNQLTWIFVIILSILGAAVLVALPTLEKKHFKYEGVEFSKEKLGAVTYYYGKTPIKFNDEVYAIFSLYLRNNPSMNKIPVEIKNLALSGRVVIAFGESSTESECIGNKVIAGGNLDQLFNEFPWIEQVWMTDYVDSEKTELIDCDDATDSMTVVRFKDSDSNYIEQDGNCYTLYTKDCEYTKTGEKLMMKFVSEMNKGN